MHTQVIEVVIVWWYMSKELALALSWTSIISIALAIMAIITTLQLLIISICRRCTRSRKIETVSTLTNTVNTDAATVSTSTNTVDAATATASTNTETTAVPLDIDAVTADASAGTMLVAYVLAVPAVKVGFLDVIKLMNDNKWLPIETSCLFRAAKQIIQLRELPFVLTVKDSITVGAVISILQHKKVVALHINCKDVSDDIITALSQDDSLQQLLMNSAITECSIVTCGRLSFAAIQRLIGSLPDSVSTLSVVEPDTEGHIWSYAIDCILHCPMNVKQLSLQLVGFKVLMPNGLRILRAHGVRPDIFGSTALPSTLRELYAHDADRLPVLPQGLQVLEMSCDDVVTDIQFGALPATLTHLKLASTQTHIIPQWPPQLQVLDLGTKYDHHLGALPPSLLELTFKLDRSAYYIEQLNTLPRDLKVLDLCNIKEQIVSLPDSLEVLRLDCYDFELPQLPPRLRELMYAGNEAEELPAELPDTLEVLDIAHCYVLCIRPIDLSMLPVSLRTLRVCSAHKFEPDDVRSTVQVQKVLPRFDVIRQQIY
jgi:hypothetical protein